MKLNKEPDEPEDVETRHEEAAREDLLYDVANDVLEAGSSIAENLINKHVLPAVKAAMAKKKAELIKKHKITSTEWKAVVKDEIEGYWEDTRESPDNWKDYEYSIALQNLK